MTDFTGKGSKYLQVGRLALLFMAPLAFSFLSLKFLPRPFVWAGLAWIGALITAMLFLHKPRLKALLFNFIFVLVILTAAEAYLTFLARGPAEYFLASSVVTEPNDWFAQDDVVGWAPKKDTRVRATKFEYGKLLYDVIYTIDSWGLRATPPPVTKPSACVLFFGDSFTFGEGLQDNATLPYQVGMRSGGTYRIYNFGVGGYGPHQMLSQIESGRVRQVINCRPDYAIYTAVPDHVARVAGKIPYGNHAPRYELDPNNEVRLIGQFKKASRTHSLLVTRLLNQMGKSGIYRIVASSQPRISQYDVRLFFAIVKRSKESADQQFPGIKFNIILWESWDGEQELYGTLADGFLQMGIPTHLVPDILPGYALGPSKYVLSRSDRHPSALSNSILADYVVERIVSAGAVQTGRN